MIALLTQNNLHDIRKNFRKQLSISACHLAESIAYGYGYKTHASLIADLETNIDAFKIDYSKFYKRLSELSLKPVSDDSIAILYDIINSLPKDYVISDIDLDSPFISKIEKYQGHIIKEYNELYDKHLKELPQVSHNNRTYYYDKKCIHEKDEESFVYLWGYSDESPFIYDIKNKIVKELKEFDIFYLPIKTIKILFNEIYKILKQGMTIRDALEMTNNPEYRLILSKQSFPNKQAWFWEMFSNNLLYIFNNIIDLLNNGESFLSTIFKYCHPLISSCYSDNMYFPNDSINLYIDYIIENPRHPKIDYISDLMYIHNISKEGYGINSIKSSHSLLQSTRFSMYHKLINSYYEDYQEYSLKCPELFIMSSIMIDSKFNHLKNRDLSYFYDLDRKDIISLF